MPAQLWRYSERIPVYEITGANLRRSRLPVAATFGLTPFVGRDNELEQLRRAMDRAVGGHGQVVSVVGEPGAGKSRLFHEFIQLGNTRGSLVLHTSSASYDKTTPYRPLIDILGAYFQIQECRRLLLRESRVQPVLLALENLHWSDSETQTFLDALVDSLPASRILLLVNYTPLAPPSAEWAGRGRSIADRQLGHRGGRGMFSVVIKVVPGSAVCSMRAARWVVWPTAV